MQMGKTIAAFLSLRRTNVLTLNILFQSFSSFALTFFMSQQPGSYSAMPNCGSGLIFFFSVFYPQYHFIVTPHFYEN